MTISPLLPLHGGGERRAFARPGWGLSFVGTGIDPQPPRQAARVASPVEEEEQQ